LQFRGEGPEDAVGACGCLESRSVAVEGDEDAGAGKVCGLAQRAGLALSFSSPVLPSMRVSLTSCACRRLR
jgi:hypothetical protein